MSFLKFGSLIFSSLLAATALAQTSGSDMQAILDAAPRSSVVTLPSEIDTTQTLHINKPLILVPAQNGTKIYGSVPVTWGPFNSDDPNYGRVRDSVKYSVRVIDLKANNINPGQVVFPSLESAAGSPVGLLTLDEDDSLLSLTRYPATGFLTCGATSGVTEFQAGAALPGNWSSQNQIGLNKYIVYGYFTAAEYFEEQMPATIDIAGGNVNLVQTDSARPYVNLQPTSRYAVQNILEELQTTGQYYIDYNLGRIYFVAANDNFKQMRVTVVAGPIISLDAGSSGTSISGNITLIDSRGSGLVASQGLTQLWINGLAVRNVYGTGLDVQGATWSTFNNINVSHTGNSGIKLYGGDLTTLSPSYDSLMNFTVNDTCQIFRAYASAVRVSGVAHNVHDGTITNSPNQAIIFDGNNLTFSNLVIDGAAQEAGDVGAIYSGQSIIQWGNFFNNITIKNIPAPLVSTKPGGGGNRYGIYFDDQLSGDSIYGVYGENTNCLVYFGGGMFNTVADVHANNCSESPVLMDDRGENWQSFFWGDLLQSQWQWASSQANNPYGIYGGYFTSLNLIEIIVPGGPLLCRISGVQIQNSPGVIQTDYSAGFTNPNGYVVRVSQN